MKAQKKLSIVLILLLIILVSIVSFIGIFYQNKNQMENVIPNYALGTDLSGYRKILLTVDEEDESNTEETLNYDNFVKSANVIKSRLKSMKIEDYTVRCDEATGQIEITIPENAQTEYILSDITQKGNFEIRNTANNEVLMNNNDIRSVKVDIVPSSYNTNTSAIYMDINFNNAGTKKFKNITMEYQNTVANDVSEENTVAESESTYNQTNTNNTASNETSTNETADNEVAENESAENNEVANETESENSSEEDNTTEIGLYIDGTSMMTTSFSQIIDNGVMSLSLGTSSSKEQTQILKYQAESLSAILENVTVSATDKLIRHGLFSKKAEVELANKECEALSVKMQNIKQYVRALSGGNKQKVAFAKWMATDCDIFLMDCPTRGIDIGVKAAIYELMERLKENEKSIIMISEELPELIGMADRIIIMKDGMVNGEFNRADKPSETQIIASMI